MCKQGYGFVCRSNKCMCSNDPRTLWSTDLNKCIQCPAGWIILNGRCYKIITFLVDWTSAKIACSNMGGYLLVCNSQDEFNNLLDLFNTYGIGTSWVCFIIKDFLSLLSYLKTKS